jgi:DNA-binding response OmpR family regulator
MKKILLCDDDYILLKLVEDRLKAEGFSVTIANDGSKAMIILNKTDFDLIITDMHMPFVTGIELIDFVRNDQNKKTPIIVLTKDITDETSENSYSVGADEYINKPVNMNILLIKIKKLLSI